jgi:hypothetical protein
VGPKRLRSFHKPSGALLAKEFLVWPHRPGGRLGSYPRRRETGIRRCKIAEALLPSTVVVHGTRALTPVIGGAATAADALTIGCFALNNSCALVEARPEAGFGHK